MCPVCAAGAAITFAGFTTTGGGIAALAAKIFRRTRRGKQSNPKSQAQRRDEHVHSDTHAGATENRVAG